MKKRPTYPQFFVRVAAGKELESMVPETGAVWTMPNGVRKRWNGRRWVKVSP